MCVDVVGHHQRNPNVHNLSTRRTDLMLGPFPLYLFNAAPTPEIYTLSLHDALPISSWSTAGRTCSSCTPAPSTAGRSEEHTSELQSRQYLVCRLLLEKKKTIRVEEDSRSAILNFAGLFSIVKISI